VQKVQIGRLGLGEEQPLVKPDIRAADIPAADTPVADTPVADNPAAGIPPADGLAADGSARTEVQGMGASRLLVGYRQLLAVGYLAER
jgi:hypothetical protein